MMIILDTNVLSELIRSEPDKNVITWLDALPPSEIATTSITTAELWYGVAKLPSGRRKEVLTQRVRKLFNEYLPGRIEPFDNDCAERYAMVVTMREAAGRPISIPDAQIAAICRTAHATLATRNTKDFVGVGIELINPWTTAKSPGH